MSAPVFLTEPGLLDDVVAGGTFVLQGEEARHAGVVQRRRVGERVDVADGAGVRLRCLIASVAPGSLGLDVTERLTEEPPPVHLVLVQALAKGDRDELAIEAATEVGIDEVVPWQAHRSVVVWRGDRAARSRARWLATVRTATKQSRRARVPLVAHAVTTAGLAERVAQVTADGGCAIVLHESATLAWSEVVLPAPGAGSVAPQVLLVVGPEGGIADDELVAMVEAGATVARLGPHVLRTSTAGPIAAALVCQSLGRWG